MRRSLSFAPAALCIANGHGWPFRDYTHGFCFVFLIGQTGLGKSTLINTIFASHLIDSKGRFASDEPVRQTTEIQAASHGVFLAFSTNYRGKD